MPPWDKWRYAFDDRQPIYRQIMLWYSQALARGEVSPGERIPSIREMAALLKVNSNTIQRVYQELEREGLIESRRGTGYFLTEDTEMSAKTRRDLGHEALERFVVEMRALGYEDREIETRLGSYLRGPESTKKGGQGGTNS
ncbi:MAG: GntR family transcriptional regulator [Treponema sp.]|nr:GntR family transcriptional regulator [Treponema sp.]